MNRLSQRDAGHDEATASTPANEEEYDYDALEAAVMQTRRGRWFLQEYLRRHRNDETRRMLKALQRLADATTQCTPAALHENAPREPTPAFAMLESLRLLLADTANRLARLTSDDNSEPAHPNMAAARLMVLLEELPANKALKALATLRQMFGRMAEVLNEPLPQAVSTDDITLQESEKDENVPNSSARPPAQDKPASDSSEAKAKDNAAAPAVNAGKQRKARIVIHRHADSRKVRIPLPNSEDEKTTVSKSAEERPRNRRTLVRLRHTRKKRAG